MERGRVGDFGLSVRAWPPSALLDPPFPGAVRTLLVTSGWCLTPARHPQGVRLTLAMLPPSALAAGTEGGPWLVVKALRRMAGGNSTKQNATTG